jgi:hypothetical protein
MGSGVLYDLLLVWRLAADRASHLLLERGRLIPEKSVLDRAAEPVLG